MSTLRTNNLQTTDNLFTIAVTDLANAVKSAQVVDSVAAVKLLNKNAASKYVNTSGYYVAGDGGGAMYYYDSTDVSSVDNGVTVIVANDGARWKLTSTGRINVKQAGAKGDGTTNDTAAFTRAAANFNSVYVPSGTYILTSPITVTDRDFSIFGDGKDLTTLRWNSSGNGIEFNDTTGIASQTRATLTVKDLTIAAGQAAAGKGIYALMTVTPTPLAYGDATSITLNDVDIRGFDQYGANTHYWTKGVHFVDTGGVYIKNVRNFGASAIAGTTGIHLQTTSASTLRYIIQGSHTAFYERGIQLESAVGKTLEGVYISGGEIVACMYGFYITGGPVHALEITNFHIDTDAECITYQPSAANSSTLSMSGSYLQRSNKARGTLIAGYLLDLNTCNFARVNGNYFLGDNSVSHYGTVVTASNGTLVENNSYQAMAGAGVIVDATSTNCKVAGNTFVNVATPYSVLGATNFADSSGANFVTHSNGITHIFGDTIVTLNASGIGSITLPNGGFKTNLYSAVVSNGDPGAVAGAPGCKLSTSTKTTLSVQVTPNPGAVSFRVGYHATGN